MEVNTYQTSLLPFDEYLRYKLLGWWVYLWMTNKCMTDRHDILLMEFSFWPSNSEPEADEEQTRCNTRPLKANHIKIYLFDIAMIDGRLWKSCWLDFHSAWKDFIKMIAIWPTKGHPFHNGWTQTCKLADIAVK